MLQREFRNIEIQNTAISGLNCWNCSLPALSGLAVFFFVACASWNDVTLPQTDSGREETHLISPDSTPMPSQEQTHLPLSGPRSTSKAVPQKFQAP
jgi:hypothetical protein